MLQERLGRLTGKMAFIKLGAASEFQMMEIRDKLVDGLNAAKSALKFVFTLLIEKI